MVTPIPDHRTAGTLVLEYLKRDGIDFDLNRPRCHGGSLLGVSIWITADNIASIRIACLGAHP